MSEVDGVGSEQTHWAGADDGGDAASAADNAVGGGGVAVNSGSD